MDGVDLTTAMSIHGLGSGSTLDLTGEWTAALEA